jgi:hypothetical protein
VATVTAVPTSAAKPEWLITKAAYPAVLLGSLLIWLFALRAPLWLDETLSYWQVSGGFGKILERSAQMPSSIGYLYTLWLAKSILGSREIALKFPSLLAALGSVYFMYRAAREIFGEETAYIACIFFCLESNVVFAATDARPYAFALLTTNLAIFAFLRWMARPNMRGAVLFGIAAAAILYFHYLFGVILPVFAVYYLALRWRSIKADARQLAALMVTFLAIAAPLLVRVASLYRGRTTHVVQPMPHPLLTTLNTLAPLQLLIGFVAAAFLAGLVRKISLPNRAELPAALFSVLLAAVPVCVLFGVSAVAGVHFVIPRYLSVVAPGSAMLWAMLTSRIDSRVLRLLLCAGLAGTMLFQAFRSPTSRRHELNFKQAHEFVNAEVASDNAPVLVGSAFIESDYWPMPTDPQADNALLSQVSYYPIHAPIIMLPMDLDDQTRQIAGQVVSTAALRHERFLMILPPTSYESGRWLIDYVGGAFSTRVAGMYDEIVVLEFRPRITE